MGKKIDFQLSKVGGPPKETAWVWHTIDLLCSPAWKVRSNQLIKLLNMLEIEHLRHGGAENGYLNQTYSQIEKQGLPRKFIAATIAEGEELGLLECEHGTRQSKTMSHMSVFRLTYLPCKRSDPDYQGGKPFYACATDEWKRIGADQAKAITQRAMTKRKAASGESKKQKTSSQTGTEPVPEREL